MQKNTQNKQLCAHFEYFFLIMRIRNLQCVSWEIQCDRCSETLSLISKVQGRNPESLQIFFQPSKEYRLYNALVWFHANQVYFPMLFDNNVKVLIKMNISLGGFPAYKLSAFLLNWGNSHGSEVDLGFLQHLRWKLFWQDLTASR